MSKRKVTLFSTWQTSQSKQARIEPEETNRSSEFEDAGSITVLFYIRIHKNLTDSLDLVSVAKEFINNDKLF